MVPNITVSLQIMLGTLILQDCALGLLLAIMPALAAKGSGIITFAVALSREGMLLLAFCAGAWVVAKYFIPRFLRSLVQLTKFNTELYLIGVIGVCLLLALISQSLGLSLEVGAFVGGLVLSGPLSAFLKVVNFIYTIFVSYQLLLSVISLSNRWLPN